MRRGMWVIGVAVAVGGWVVAGRVSEAAEHGGKEHGGTEHGGAPTSPSASQPTSQPAPAVPSAQAIRAFIQQHVEQSLSQDGTFAMRDDKTGTTRRLTFARVHDRVGKTGALYYSCTDMRDADSGELLDLDFDVQASGGHLEVVGARIHKVNGKARYTYDDKDHRIPLPSENR